LAYFLARYAYEIMSNPRRRSGRVAGNEAEMTAKATQGTQNG
jgi:hypothetical protein